jgi:hypothetical protein
VNLSSCDGAQDNGGRFTLRHCGGPARIRGRPNSIDLDRHIVRIDPVRPRPLWFIPRGGRSRPPTVDSEALALGVWRDLRHEVMARSAPHVEEQKRVEDWWQVRGLWAPVQRAAPLRPPVLG